MAWAVEDDSLEITQTLQTELRVIADTQKYKVLSYLLMEIIHLGQIEGSDRNTKKLLLPSACLWPY